MATFNPNGAMQTMTNEQLPGVIIGKLMNIGGMLQRQGNKMLLPYSLNQQQFSIFFEIAKAGKVKQKDMVNRLVLEKAHVSKVVKKLQKMELVDISEDHEDRRSRWLSVTGKGEATIKQCTEMFGKWNKGWSRGISEAALLSMLDSLTTLQSIFKQNTPNG